MLISNSQSYDSILRKYKETFIIFSKIGPGKKSAKTPAFRKTFSTLIMLYIYIMKFKLNHFISNKWWFMMYKCNGNLSDSNNILIKTMYHHNEILLYSLTKHAYISILILNTVFDVWSTILYEMAHLKSFKMS